MANVESPEALVKIVFDVPGAAAFEGLGVAALEVPEAVAFEVPEAAAFEVPGAAAFEVPGAAASEVPGAAALEVPGAAAFEGSVTTAFNGPAVVFDCMAAAFEGPAEVAAVFSCASLDRMPPSGWVAEAWNSVLSGGDVEGEFCGVLKNTQNIKLFTMSPVLFFLEQQVVFIILCDLNKVVVELT